MIHLLLKVRSNAIYYAMIQYSSPTEDSDGGAVIGGVVAVVVLTVIALGLVVVLVLLVKKKRSKVQVSGQVNPFYMEGTYYINFLVVFMHNVHY